jgi:polyisoprenoid-binding protein YceI
MKKTIFFMLMAIGSITMNAQNWNLDNSHSSVNFSITHMVVSEVQGSFKKFTAKVDATKDDFTDAKIDFTIDANSVNTDNEDRDKHLRSGDFFETEKYPEIKFTSTSIKKINGKVYELKGNITMHGVTKPAVFTLTFNGIIKDPYGFQRAGFKAKTTIKRSDFNLSWNKTLDAGGVVLSDEVNIDLNIEITKK